MASQLLLIYYCVAGSWSTYCCYCAVAGIPTVSGIPTSASLPPFKRRPLLSTLQWAVSDNDDVTVDSPSRLFSSRGWVTGRVNKDYLSPKLRQVAGCVET
jgi:hypothetical protein